MLVERMFSVMYIQPFVCYPLFQKKKKYFLPSGEGRGSDVKIVRKCSPLAARNRYAHIFGEHCKTVINIMANFRYSLTVSLVRSSMAQSRGSLRRRVLT